MLTELLRLLEQNQGQLDLAELSQQLNAQPSAVAGMLEMLIRKGRIDEMGGNCGTCQTCVLRNECDLPANRAKRFRLSTKVPTQG